MVLDGKNRVFPVLDPFDRPIIEVKVGDLERLGTGHVARFTPDGKSVILGCDKYLSCRKIAHWMVAAAMAVRQLDRFAAQREAEQLVAEADAKDGEVTV